MKNLLKMILLKMTFFSKLKRRKILKKN